MEEKPIIYSINPHKLDKYLLEFLNGGGYQLEKRLPNLLAVASGISGTVERETYDYRTTQFRKKDPTGYNSKIAKIFQQIDAMKQNKQTLIIAIAEFKIATDQHHEKTKVTKY